jgi:hypothetical protein
MVFDLLKEVVQFKFQAIGKVKGAIFTEERNIWLSFFNIIRVP